MNIKTITKKNGTTVYRASIYLGTDKITGKKVRTTITAKTQKALKTLERQKLNEFERNGYTVQKKANVSNYSQLVDLWWESYRHTVKANTIINVRTIINRYLLPELANIKLSRLSPVLMQDVVNRWAVKVKHYHRLHALNKRILQYGVSIQALQVNPARDVIVPRRKQDEKKKVKHLDSQDLKKFLDYLDTLPNTYTNVYDNTLYRFLLATGVRISEALALEWTDIDLENATVSVTKTLNRLKEVNSPKSVSSIRTISIDQKTILMLRLYQNRQRIAANEIKSPYREVVFSPLVRKYNFTPWLKNRLSKKLIQAGLKSHGFHVFRHTHASLLLNAGIGYKELQHRLGHSTISMTMDIYSHLSKEKEKEAVNLFDKAINSL